MAKRAIEPRLGFWTVPAGFMENGETMQAAAARECYEEALAKVEIGSLLAVSPTTARAIRDGAEVEVPTEQLLLGDRVIIRPGERIAVDGVVVAGRSADDH